MGFESFAPWLVLALCLPVGHAAKPTDIVVKWQDTLFQNISKKAHFDQSDIDEYKTAISELRESWSKQSEMEESEETMRKMTDALDAFSVTFMDGFDDVANGDLKSVSNGVLNIFSGALATISAFVPGCAVAGAVFSALTPLLNFIFTLTAPKQGKTSLTTQISNIIDHALDEFKYDELNEDFSANLELAKATLLQFDLNGMNVTSLDDAKAVLRDMDFPGINSRFIDFMGRTSGALSDILQSNDPRKADKTYVPILFNMYSLTRMCYTLLQQRALNVLSISFSKSTSGDLTIDQQVYTVKLRTLRDITKDHLRSWNSTLHDFADYIFMGDPNQPASQKNMIYLQLYSKLDHHDHHWLPGTYAVGQTDKGSGDLYATIRENSPSQIEVQWEDGTKWMNNHIVFEGESISFINKDTADGNSKNVVLMYSRKSSWVMRYCDITKENCGDSGSTQKIDQALFTMTRVGYDRIIPDYRSKTILPLQQKLGPRKSGPMRSGDVVTIHNVHRTDYVMCGNYDSNSTDLKKNDVGDAWYLTSMWHKYCKLNQWRVVVKGNEELQELASAVSSAYAKLVRTDSDLTQTAGDKMLLI